jgi:putative hydrolase of the HAD superfamily
MTGAKVRTSVMIGDNLSTDMKGARDFGLDQIFFNPSDVVHKDEVTYEVNSLLEIKTILF